MLPLHFVSLGVWILVYVYRNALSQFTFISVIDDIGDDNK